LGSLSTKQDECATVLGTSCAGTAETAHQGSRCSLPADRN
jgi:hypothetical protein